MTKEISKEVIAKVFGLHLGAEVQNNIGKHMGKLVSMCIDGTATINPLDRFEPRLCSSGILRLILSDLSDISEADAVEVCRLLDFNSGDKAQMAYLGRGVILFHFCNTIPYDDSLFDTSLSRKFISTVSQPGMVNVIDFLRSRGYMLPAHGTTDLFEAGIAVRKETIKK